jgi:hypothetical protein
MKILSTRRYTETYAIWDSERIFDYLVKSKTDWLNTFKLLISKYGHEKNQNSQRARILMTDYAKEIHEHDFSEFLLQKGIKLYNLAPNKYLYQIIIERYNTNLENHNY